MGLSILQLADKLRTEADAYKFLEQLRWNGQPACPHCGAIEPYFLNPQNGSTRRTRTGSESPRRVWKCRACRKQFSVLTGTIFHGTKIPVRTWVFVVFEMASSKNGVAAREIERKYGLTPKSAWFMMHRIREAMKREPMAGLLTGRVVLDETYTGGKPKNRHGHKYGKGGQGTTDKTAVVALVSRETGEVRTKVVPNVTGENLRAAMAGEVEPERTVIHTDRVALPAHPAPVRRSRSSRSQSGRVRTRRRDHELRRELLQPAALLADWLGSPSGRVPDVRNVLGSDARGFASHEARPR